MNWDLPYEFMRICGFGFGDFARAAGSSLGEACVYKGSCRSRPEEVGIEIETAETGIFDTTFGRLYQFI